MYFNNKLRHSLNNIKRIFNMDKILQLKPYWKSKGNQK